jgi:hypothetical protein
MAGDEDEDDRRSRDSARGRDSLANLFADTVSRAEILAPGIRLPVLDAATPPKVTMDRICALRRRAIVSAMDASPDMAARIRDLAAGASVRNMTCDGLGVLFVAASDRARDSNNVALGRIVARDASSGQRPKGPPTNKELNAQHAEFWKNRRSGYGRPPKS